MIVTEYYRTRSDGVVLNRTYSDAGLLIERDGVQYSEAIDPADMGREYTEVPGTAVDVLEEQVLAGLAEVAP